MRLDFLIIAALQIIVKLTQTLTSLANNILIASITISLMLYFYFLVSDIIYDQEEQEEDNNDLP